MMENDRAFLPHISWGAIFGGAVLALAIQFMLSLLGAGIGLVSADGVDLSQLGWGASLWYAATFLIALFCGGFVASRLSGNIMSYAGVFNSLVVWALVVGLNLTIAGTGASSLAKGFGNSVGFVANSFNMDAPSFRQVTNIDLENIQERFDELLAQTENEEIKKAVQQEIDNIQAAAKEAGSQMLRRPGEIGEIFSNFAREAQSGFNRINRMVGEEDLAEIFAARTDMDQEEAMRAAQRWERELTQLGENFQQRLDEARRTVTRQAQQAADVTGAAALWTFGALLIGMLVAVIAGRLGRRRTLPEIS